MLRKALTQAPSPVVRWRTRASAAAAAAALAALTAILAVGPGPVPARAAVDPEILAKLEVGQPYRDPEGGVTVTFLQKNASQAAPPGWRTARSLGCGFAVGLPGPFNELKIVGATTDGAALITDSIGTKTAAGCKLTAICFERSDHHLSPTAVADAMAQAAGTGTRLAQSATAVAGHPAAQIRVRTKSAVFGMQVVKVEGRLYQQMLECPQSEEPSFDRLERRYFATLALPPPGAKP